MKQFIFKLQYHIFLRKSILFINSIVTFLFCARSRCHYDNSGLNKISNFFSTNFHQNARVTKSHMTNSYERSTPLINDDHFWSGLLVFRITLHITGYGQCYVKYTINVETHFRLDPCAGRFFSNSNFRPKLSSQDLTKELIFKFK